MHNYLVYVLLVLLIDICESREEIHLSPRANNQKLGTCKSQLGEAKDTFQTVKEFLKQVEEIIPGFTESSSLKNVQLEMKRLDSKLKQLTVNMKKMENEQKVSVKYKGGATYTRWGKSSCKGNQTETVYVGQVGGGHHSHAGSSVNYICLPNDPDHADQLSGNVDLLYGGEYEISKSNKPHKMKSGLYENDVPCAVCRALKRSSTIMIPGRKRCYKNWTREYDGYLMAGYYGHTKGSEYACVDKNPDVIKGGSANKDGALFYPVKVTCGSLKCPPYTQGTDVSCVVCSK